jgi:tetratricopeptide (TPR) repeat protein/tRNA A-37 threonylcarbamoyl transferase component Bud32
MEDDQTLPADDGPDAAGAIGFSPIDPECYELNGEVARGNFGRVMAARDRRLDRSVAIKLLHQRGGSLEARFRREALVTARLPHPSIVPIYEVGQFPGGELFYAMKLISGSSLRDVIAAAGSLDDRIALLPHVIAAADAIAYAHSRNIIHRDLKPANIMVGAFGETVVIDWGLAKALQDPDVEAEHPSALHDSAELTSAGAVVGTPAYMPPEQAQGSAVDARADVYSLGAILYHTLSGRPPYRGDSDSVIEQVRSGPPPALEKIEPGTPSELAAIVRNAMQRAPEQRYPSAREMVDDLRRFQTGQLVRAHRYSPLVLGRRWMTRHPRFMTLVLLGVLVAGAAGLVGRERKAAAARLRLAADLSAQVEREKARLDVDYRSPLHDTRPTIAAVKEHMRGIEAELSTGRDSDRALGLYALARVHMTLREFPAARQELEAAMRLSDHPAEVQAALGRTMAELYGEALHDLETLPPPLRAQRAKALQQSLRDPALQLLKREASSALVRGIIALFEERFDEALVLARQAAVEDPTGYEGLLLQGDVEIARTIKEKLSGHRAEALAGLDRAGAAYRAAAEIGRSDPFAHQRECQRTSLVVDVQRNTSRLERKVADEAVAACERAQRANPDLPSILLDEAHLYEQLAENNLLFGLDPRPELQRGVALVEEALRIDPEIPDGDLRIARSHRNLSTWQVHHGVDPRPTFALIRSHLEAAIKRRPTAEVYHSLGENYTNEADYLIGLGEDPTAGLKKAIEMSEHATQLEDRASTHFNIAGSYLMLAVWEIGHGRSPTAYLAQARKQTETFIAMNPSVSWGLDRLGIADRLEGVFEWESGRDARALFERALDLNTRGRIKNEDVVDLETQRTLTLREYAETLIDEGKDATARLAEGRAAIDKAIAVDRENYSSYQRLAEIELLRARSSRSPAAAFAEVERALVEAERLSPTEPLLLITRAMLARWKAHWQLARGDDASATVAAGLKTIDSAITSLPHDALAAAVRGALEAQRARITRDPGSRSAALERARGSLERALGINPLLARRYRPLLDEISAAATR